MMGGLIRSCNNGQGAVATSCGEAELKASAEAPENQSLAADMGLNLGVELHVGSLAAKAIASRLGFGRVRHLEVRSCGCRTRAC